MIRAGHIALAATLALATPLAAQDKQIKQYENGGVYEGTFKNGLQHGKGSYTLPNGFERDESRDR